LQSRAIDETKDSPRRAEHGDRKTLDMGLVLEAGVATRAQAAQDLQRAGGNAGVEFVRAAARHLNDQVEARIAGRIEQGEGRGDELAPTARQTLEHGLGVGMRDIRVHTDGDADELAQTLDAVAFTSGRDIYFRTGAYDPRSADGLLLLAHEAAHVIQQAAGPVEGTPTPGGRLSLSDPADSFEQAASRAAAATVAGERVDALPASPVSSRRRNEKPVQGGWLDDLIFGEKHDEYGLHKPTSFMERGLDALSTTPDAPWYKQLGSAAALATLGGPTVLWGHMLDEVSNVPIYGDIKHSQEVDEYHKLREEAEARGVDQMGDAMNLPPEPNMSEELPAE
jgi:hypothetical protein